MTAWAETAPESQASVFIQNAVISSRNANSVVVEAPHIKNVVEGEPESDAVFCFALIASKYSHPMPDGSSDGEKFIYITGTNGGDFGKWIYTKPGTYSYYCSEVDTGVSGYTYDKSTYTLVDTVTETEDGLDVKRSMTDGEGNQVYTDSLTFTNIYDKEAAVAADKEKEIAASRKASVKDIDESVSTRARIYVIAGISVAFVIGGMLTNKMFKK